MNIKRKAATVVLIIAVAALAVESYRFAQDADASSTVADSPTVARLRVVAHAKGLQWKIWCSRVLGHEAFYVWAVPKNRPFSNYIEDGAVEPYWVESAATRDEAAKWLMDHINSPNTQPSHSPAHDSASCAPEVRGD